MSKCDFLRILCAMLVSLAFLPPLHLGAQNVTLELKNVTVQEAVTQLQSQGNYTIVINSDDVDLQKRISVSAKDASLSEVLAQIFKGQDLDFSVNSNTVSVNRRKASPQVSSARHRRRPLRRSADRRFHLRQRNEEICPDRCKRRLRLGRYGLSRRPHGLLHGL